MTREEYRKLVQSTYSFSQLDADEQAKILNAEGDEMEYYVNLFQGENDTMGKAINDFRSNNDQVILEFKFTVKKDKEMKLKASEKAEKSKDDQILKKLLKKI